MSCRSTLLETLTRLHIAVLLLYSKGLNSNSKSRYSSHIQFCFFAMAFENPVLKNFLIQYKTTLNPIQDGLFWGCSWMEGGGQKGPPSLKSVTHMLQWSNLAQLYLTQSRSKKYMNRPTHPLSSADICIFSLEISKFCYTRNTDIDCILIHNFYSL